MKRHREINLDELLTTEELANEARHSPRIIRRWMDEGRIKETRFGRKRLATRRAFLAFITKQSKK